MGGRGVGGGGGFVDNKLNGVNMGPMIDRYIAEIASRIVIQRSSIMNVVFITKTFID